MATASVQDVRQALDAMPYELQSEICSWLNDTMTGIMFERTNARHIYRENYDTIVQLFLNTATPTQRASFKDHLRYMRIGYDARKAWEAKEKQITV